MRVPGCVSMAHLILLSVDMIMNDGNITIWMEVGGVGGGDRDSLEGMKTSVEAALVSRISK